MKTRFIIVMIFIFLFNAPVVGAKMDNLLLYIPPIIASGNHEPPPPPPPPLPTPPGYGEVESAGQIWLNRNLGASRIARSYDDSAAYGDLYQWGRGTDGHEKRASGTTSTLSNSDTPGHGDFITTSTNDWRSPQNADLWQGVSGVNNPCPAGFRLPTITEWQAERSSWGPNLPADAYNSPLKLVPAGLRTSSDGELFFQGGMAYYWSGTVDGNQSRNLFYLNSSVGMNSSDRAEGFSVRCIKDWAPEYGTVDSAGQTWLDRNLGASRVATAYNDSAAYGDLYQWGRGTDGHEKRASRTTSTLSTSNMPGHGNFILSTSEPYDWRTPQNDNLWQGANGTNNPCPAGFRLPTETEWETERVSWTTDDTTGAYNSPLKLPAGGGRSFLTGNVDGDGSYGQYWSSSVWSTPEDGNWSGYVYIRTSRADYTYYFRLFGHSVRCIQD